MSQSTDSSICSSSNCDLKETSWISLFLDQKNTKILTTFGLNGGVIFLLMRSSQLIREKKIWFLISICWTETRDLFRWQNSIKGPRSGPSVFVPKVPWRRDSGTYKVFLGTQPLCPVLLQEALQEVPCWICNIWFQLEGLVQNVVVHLSCVPAIKRRLEKEENPFRFNSSFV